jgi:hypothetical protein
MDILKNGHFAENRDTFWTLKFWAYTVKVSVIKVIVDFADRSFDSKV